MGAEFVLFVAGADVLAELFPGWKPALAKPITRTGVNPFTKAKMTIVVETEEYGEDEEVESGCNWNRFQELAPPSIGQELNGQCIAKLATPLALTPPLTRRALSEPPGSETVVFELVPAVVGALAGVAPKRHAALGKALRSDLPSGEATALFGRLVELAADAKKRKQRLYLIEEV